jgi:hypothetical protein
MDGILTDLRTQVVKMFNEKFGTSYTTFDILDYHAVYKWSLELGQSKNAAGDIQEWLWFDPEVLMEVQPVSGALKFVNWFIDRDIDIPIITSRRSDPKTVDVTHKWINKWIPNFPLRNLYMQKGNSKASGDIFKAQTIKLLKRGIHFEDVYEHAKTILDLTDSLVVLHSNLSIVDNSNHKRLIRIPEKPGVGPTLEEINKHFLRI